MGAWIPFREGEYMVERASLFAPDTSAVLLEDAVISVFSGPSGERGMEGTCRVRNILLVRLLDDHDLVDLALDFGEEFKYVLPDPRLRSGKVFSPEVVSHLQFAPRSPWRQVPPEEFEALWSGLRFLAL